MSYYLRKVRCPRHYVLKPGKSPFKMVPNPLLKNVSASAIDQFGLRRLIPKKDRLGQKEVDYNNFHQPEISAAFAIEHVWDPKNHICQECKRCLEGKENVREMGIKRLNGHFAKT